MRVVRAHVSGKTNWSNVQVKVQSGAPGASRTPGFWFRRPVFRLRIGCIDKWLLVWVMADPVRLELTTFSSGG